MGEGTSAASAYVGMTRGRHDNVAHLVAETPEQARSLWEGTCSRDRADLGVAHARLQAIDDIDRYGPVTPARARAKEQVKRRPRNAQRCAPRGHMHGMPNFLNFRTGDALTSTNAAIAASPVLRPSQDGHTWNG